MSSLTSSIRHRTSVAWVCSWSHGQPSGARSRAMVAFRLSIALMRGTCPRNRRNTRKFFGFEVHVFPVFRGRFMADKLTEIMAWKRREIAPYLRDVSEAELARIDGTVPRPLSFATALRRADG